MRVEKSPFHWHDSCVLCWPLPFFAAVLQDISEVYLAPGLKLAHEHLQPLLDEAADVQRRLAALGC